MKKFITIILVVSATIFTATAQDLDRYGRDKDSKVTSGGVLAQADVAAMMIRDVAGFSSRPGFGGSVGGFIDFKLVPRCVIQFALMGNIGNQTLHRDGAPVGPDSPSDGGPASGQMRTYGLMVPVCIMYKHPFADGGALYVGGGPYTEFVVGCSVKMDGQTFNPYEQVVGSDLEGNDVFALSNNNSGLNAKLIYEFPFHMQIYLSGSYSISDILGYQHAEGSIHPWRTSIGLAFRFR